MYPTEQRIFPGTFIVVEGGDGVGKTTQIDMLARRYDAVVTGEPGGTELGHQIRSLLLHGTDIDPVTEMLLYAADRAEHVAQVIVPALEAGRTVICSRFSWSSLAYQGLGRGLGVDLVASVDAAARTGVAPDVVVVLDVDHDVAAQRTVNRGEIDRMEQAGSQFHATVRDAFRAFAADDPAAVVVDAAGTAGQVHAAVVAGIEQVLGRPL